MNYLNTDVEYKILIYAIFIFDKLFYNCRYNVGKNKKNEHGLFVDIIEIVAEKLNFTYACMHLYKILNILLVFIFNIINKFI